MIADFESLTQECSEEAGKSTHKYQKHKAISYCLKLISFDDPHSYSNPQKIRITHMDLDLKIDWKAHILSGKVTLNLDK